MFVYHVDAFVPPQIGCMKRDPGWSPKRCKEFGEFLNHYASQGWRLHSCEYRDVNMERGCSGVKGQWLVCVFEKKQDEAKE